MITSQLLLLPQRFSIAKCRLPMPLLQMLMQLLMQMLMQQLLRRSRGNFHAEAAGEAGVRLGFVAQGLGYRVLVLLFRVWWCAFAAKFLVIQSLPPPPSRTTSTLSRTCSGW
jgi:hypothetical protein